MKRKKDLSRLIGAMSSSEKRYFTLDAQKSGRKASRYLELFQAINEMEEYDEGRLKEKFGKNLSSDKGYLYEAILRSMRDYRSASSLAARSREMILDAKYLYERGLYEQCGERLNNAKTLAQQLDDNVILLEIVKEQRRINRESRKKQYESRIKSLSRETNEIIRSVDDEIRYLDIYDELLMLVLNKFEFKDNEEKEALTDKYYPLLSTKEESAILPTALRRYYQCWALYYQLLGDVEQVFQHYEMVVDWWDQHPAIKSEDFHHYIVDVSNYLHACATEAKYDYFPSLLNSLKSTQPKNIHDKGLVFQKYSIYQLMYHINTGEIVGIDALIRDIEKGLSTFFISKTSELVLIFNSSILLFISEKFADCITWANKIIRQKKLSGRQDIQHTIRIIYLIAEYEAGSFDAVERAFRSVNRYFRNNRQLAENSFEYYFLNKINELQNATPSGKRQLLETFRKELQDKSGFSGKIPFGIDELLLWWINARLQRSSIVEMVKRDLQQATTI